MTQGIWKRGRRECGDCLDDPRGPVCTMNCSSAEMVWPPKSVSSAKLIAMLDDPRVAAAVNDKGGGRGA